MSEEYLEALEEIRDFRYGEDKLLVCQTEMYNIIKQALQRLKAIDNSNSSEALKKLDIIENELWDSDFHYQKYSKELDTIEQALLKAQEDEKKVEALKELFENHIEFVVEEDRCYFKIKNSKGKEKSFTSYTMLDFWKEALE